jgi:hypothetical protein
MVVEVLHNRAQSKHRCHHTRDTPNSKFSSRMGMQLSTPAALDHALQYHLLI